jgi:hypothetical protein
MRSMTLPRRQRRLLGAIDRQLTSADPRLARLLGAFGRHWAGESLPAHEQLPVRTGPSWPGLWRILAAGAWGAPPLIDLPAAGAARTTGTERGAASAAPDQTTQGPDGPEEFA